MIEKEHLVYQGHQPSIDPAATSATPNMFLAASPAGASYSQPTIMVQYGGVARGPKGRLLDGDCRSIGIKPGHIMSVLKALGDKLRGVDPKSDDRTIITTALKVRLAAADLSLTGEQTRLLLQHLDVH